MQVEVGTALQYKGRNYICIAIEQISLEELAREDSASAKQWMLAGENVRCLEQAICEFSSGDIIHKTGERITLECPGVDLQYIWTSYTIKQKEKTSGLTGNEGSVGQSTGDKVEGSGQRDTSGEGVGQESVSEVGT